MHDPLRVTPLQPFTPRTIDTDILRDDDHRSDGYFAERHVFPPKPPPTGVHDGHRKLPRNAEYHRYRKFSVVLPHHMELDQGMHLENMLPPVIHVRC